MNATQLIAQDLSIQLYQVETALALFAEGATVPFVARYRKERTGELNEVQLRQIAERFEYLSELTIRKKTILEAIEQQGALTSELRQRIELTQSKTELEDLYLPYRPKRRTRATIAKEKGLEPLAKQIDALNVCGGAVAADMSAIAQPYLNKVVTTTEEALQGAADILAEAMAEQATLRSYVRQYLLRNGQFVSKVKPEHKEGSTKYEMYRSYKSAVSKIASHNLLALLRGSKEGVLRVSLSFDEAEVLAYLLGSQLQSRDKALKQFYTRWVKDGFNRLMKTSLTNEVIAEKKAWADEVSIETFADNLRNLLLAAPAGMKATLGVDPGFRTGCKVAAIGETGQFLEYEAIYPHSGEGRRLDAIKILHRLIRSHGIKLIAIGNGTASRETDEFIAASIADMEAPPVRVIVNESGASIYSASEVAIEEFPDLDVTVRGAISIARRLQDPLAELVKLDPKSIGVGQYQHDVDQKKLRQKLDDTVESCVNYVGVDLNTASRELLQYVSGVSKTIANNVVSFRNDSGGFDSRKKLLKVSKLGPKAYEQAAGFLRIRDGKNPLDNTAVHPERYDVVKQMAKDLNVPLQDIPQAAEKFQAIDLEKYTTDEVGEPTLKDILAELEKPGRDPRAQFAYATFAKDIHDISDLKEGMVLEGVVTNVANFGAFVDIGVHQDGLVHVSQMADRFVKDPKEVVQVGQVVKVCILEIQEKLRRIGLSMRLAEANGNSKRSLKSQDSKMLSLKPRAQSSDSQSGDSQSSRLQNSGTCGDKPQKRKAVEKPVRKKDRPIRTAASSIANGESENDIGSSNAFNPQDLQHRFNSRRP